ncbi:MAG: BrnT family toxin [Pyrinomonadaceae bacterium]
MLSDLRLWRVRSQPDQNIILAIFRRAFGQHGLKKARTSLSRQCKHGIDFSDAWQILEGPTSPELDLQTDYGEDRWTVIGLLGDRVVVVNLTFRSNETFRIISLRKASRHEREKFEEEI